MNTLLLQPTDVLFFRDGRPMGGSLGGHGAAWPLPTVASAALHAALHRADLEKASGARLHGHDHHRNDGERINDVRKFGSLVSAGPFPVIKDKDGKEAWLFPRPLDAGIDKDENDSTQPTLLPLAEGFTQEHSSLPPPLKLAIANTCGPTKKSPSPWWNAAAWETYLGTVEVDAKPAYHEDSAFADTEFSYGIGMNPDTGTQDGERFYSAHYLRLKPEGRLGLLAESQDKINGDPNDKRDLIISLFPNNGSQTPVIVGGQQRRCTVESHHHAPVPLPKGKTDGFESKDAGEKSTWLVKWVLLTPAIFPVIPDKDKNGNPMNPHPGGWLPNWVFLDWDSDKGEAREHADNGRVMLKLGDTARREREGRETWRRRVAALPNITATLVAALTGKPIPVTGYALPNQDVVEIQGGAKHTHLAVPAGSVYYFTCTTKDAAEKLAAALNWHGKEDFTTIKNRRSTLMGEKGFGLGVCGTWQFHDGQIPT
ncbi:MAG: type III-B CRISPR module-associated Cmr3 family protein [Prosthecobacter sp.]|uniref:type III-B CRISPR module-associated Cmr3 family protein n=1 Tax=Prosthecobacter sp. TaxID=1965333 RepID=UPI0038FE5A4B